MVSAPGELAIAPGDADAKGQSEPSGSIHIEFPGRALISVERRADPTLLGSILESLRK
jgi:hypothetical protein